jgi:hypothetical protein
MNKEVAEKWVAALRSGEYTQAREQLRKNNNNNDQLNYCCLGVLCDLAVKEDVTKWKDTEKDNYRPDNFLRNTDVVPNSSVQIWAEMKNVNGTYEPEKPNLWQLNDDHGKTFLEIADIIEQNYEAL